jgi:F-type H+-transporting ATPase subunit gamma
MEVSELALRTRAIAQLADVVQAMRTLASARRRQAQERTSALSRYAAATRITLNEALALLGADAEPMAPPTGARRVVTLFSEHGFVGPLNDRVLDEAVALARSRNAGMLAVGSRGRRLCRERGVDAADGGAMPTTPAAVRTTAGRLIDDLLDAVAEGNLSEVQIVFAEHRPPLGWKPRALRVFPPEGTRGAREAARERPVHTLPPRLLVVRAIEEDAFAQVSWAVGEAFASEQAARFVAMDAAHHHIENKLGELRALERTLRQETVTNEILEIASGAALVGGTT